MSSICKSTVDTNKGRGWSNFFYSVEEIFKKNETTEWTDLLWKETDAAYQLI